MGTYQPLNTSGILQAYLQKPRMQNEMPDDQDAPEGVGRPARAAAAEPAGGRPGVPGWQPLPCWPCSPGSGSTRRSPAAGLSCWAAAGEGTACTPSSSPDIQPTGVNMRSVLEPMCFQGPAWILYLLRATAQGMCLLTCPQCIADFFRHGQSNTGNTSLELRERLFCRTTAQNVLSR